jgi:plasmid stability protein
VSVNLSIKDVPEELAERLRQRAARHHRSLQGELRAIIELAVAEPTAETGSPAAGRSWVQGWKTIEQLVSERRAEGWQPDPAMAGLPRGVDIIRADRDSR